MQGCFLPYRFEKWLIEEFIGSPIKSEENIESVKW